VRWLIAVLLWLAPCAASAHQVHLRWSAPIGSMCPTGSTLSADVEQLTGQRFVAHEDEAEVRVVGRVERTELGVVAQLTAHTADGTPIGTRELRLDTDDCAQLRRPLAMVLTLLLDQPIEPRRGIGFALGVDVAGDTHVMPRTTTGIGLTSVLTPIPQLGLRATFDYWTPVVARTARDVGARMQELGGSLSLCPRLVAGTRMALWACFGAQGGVILAAPHGLLESTTKQLAFADALAELAGSLRVGKRTHFWLSTGPLFSLLRPELYLDRADGSRLRVHKASPIGAIFRAAVTIGRL
jgi:hypothetical protein